MNIKRLVILAGTAILGLTLVQFWPLSANGTGLQISHAAGYDASQKPDHQEFLTIVSGFSIVLNKAMESIKVLL